MTKILIKYLISCLLILLSAGCSNDSIQTDAKRLATIQCKALKLMKKVSDGDISLLEESTSMANKASALQKEFELKYTSEKEISDFKQALDIESKNCK